MKDVLEDIQVKKESKKYTSRVHLSRQNSISDTKPISKENKPYNLEYYIKSHAQVSHTKPLIIKKGKSNSILTILSKDNQPRYQIHSKKA